MRAMLIRCYPARWRARYGEEFAAILGERPLGPFDVFDILLGALDARLRIRCRDVGTHGWGFDMSLRIGGIAAVTGATIFGIAGFLLLGWLPSANEALASSLVLVGLAVLLVALAGLSAFQARTQPHLAWAAFLVPAIGTLAIIAAAITQRALDIDGDGFYAGDAIVQVVLAIGGLTAFIGSALFGIATYRAGVLSRRGALLLVAAPVIAVIAGLSIALWEMMILLFSLSVVVFMAGWYWLGIQALRQGRVSTEARAA